MTRSAQAANLSQPKPPSQEPPCEVSLVVPVYNERENLQALIDEILQAMQPLGKTFEVILVDDGSQDGSAELLDQLAEAHPQVRVAHFDRNYGQTAAMAAGFTLASGAVIVPLDADRQNDPADIPKMLETLEQGYDVVSGWRRQRQDNWLRRLPSRIANGIIGRVTGVRLHDYGCTLKAYRSEFIKQAALYGQMHRFLPVYAAMAGARITEIETHHRPRTAGVSKYGIARTFRVILDLVLVQMLYKYPDRPSHLLIKPIFGSFALAGVGLVLALAGLLAGSGLFSATFFLAALLGLGTGLSLVGLGVVLESLARIRYEATGRRPWRIARCVNLPDADERCKLDPAWLRG